MKKKLKGTKRKKRGPRTSWNYPTRICFLLLLIFWFFLTLMQWSRLRCGPVWCNVNDSVMISKKEYFWIPYKFQCNYIANIAYLVLTLKPLRDFLKTFNSMTKMLNIFTRIWMCQSICFLYNNTAHSVNHTCNLYLTLKIPDLCSDVLFRFICTTVADYPQPPPAATYNRSSHLKKKKFIRNDENAISSWVYIHVRHHVHSISLQLNKHTHIRSTVLSASSAAQLTGLNAEDMSHLGTDERWEKLMTLILISDSEIKTEQILEFKFEFFIETVRRNGHNHVRKILSRSLTVSNKRKLTMINGRAGGRDGRVSFELIHIFHLIESSFNALFSALAGRVQLERNVSCDSLQSERYHRCDGEEMVFSTLKLISIFIFPCTLFRECFLHVFQFCLLLALAL